MANANVTRQGRSLKFTKAFVRDVAAGKRPGKWTDTDSPLRIKATAKGAQYLVTRKREGRVVTITPSGADGPP